MRQNLIDFSSCRIVPGKAYNGANGSKIAVDYAGTVYMLKFPPSGAGKPTELSYTNSCISEHIASSIFNLLGITAQETMLGYYRVGEKAKVVCACQDFAVNGNRLLDFCSIKNTILESESNGSGTELDDIIDAIERQKYIDPHILKDHFWSVFVVDALLGNFDRHNGNWGFLFNENTGETQIAPVYDCGSCLLPQADEKVMRRVLASEEELNARVYQFPTSAVKLKGRKINYYDFLNGEHPDECDRAISRIVPRVDLDIISDFIESVPVITEIQKRFYKQYLNARYNLILLPAFNVAEHK